MTVNNLKKTWNLQYKSGDDTALKDKNLFNIEINIIISQLKLKIHNKSHVNILELGCGTGYFLRIVQEELSKIKNFTFNITGVDFSDSAILYANNRSLSNTRFECKDFSEFLRSNNKKFDIIVTQRSLMAIMEENDQEIILKQMHDALTSKGAMVLSECFSNQFKIFNKMRKDAGLTPIEKVWHSRYIDESMLDRNFDNIVYIDFCSTYMLITRLIYPMFEDSPKHNQFIHDYASCTPESGSNSYLKIVIITKNSKIG